MDASAQLPHRTSVNEGHPTNDEHFCNDEPACACSALLTSLLVAIGVVGSTLNLSHEGSLGVELR